MQDMLQFLDACMLKQRLPDAAFEKFEQLSSKQLEGLHRLIKDLQVICRSAHLHDHQHACQDIQIFGVSKPFCLSTL